MGQWLRVGRRLEWTLAVMTALGVLVNGFISTNRAPSNIRWMVWAYVGGFYIVMSFSSLLLVQFLRRRRTIVRTAAKSSEHARPINRVKIYLAAAAVTAISATSQARSVAFRHRFTATTGDIFFWNFAALAVFASMVELLEWWKRHSSNDRH